MKIVITESDMQFGEYQEYIQEIVEKMRHSLNLYANIVLKRYSQDGMPDQLKDAENLNMRLILIVKNAEIVNDTIAISIYDEKTKDTSLVCAKAADELLTISDITASFVIGNLGDKICISGRSIGDINVQIILEKLGGGGHITLAGAQVEGMTIEETKQELINRINEYFSEIES